VLVALAMWVDDMGAVSATMGLGAGSMSAEYNHTLIIPNILSIASIASSCHVC
jgi:hypothetical protein